MKKSRFTDSQILAILNVREHGMSSASFYQWRAKYGGMDASFMKHSRESGKAISEAGDGERGGG